MAVYRIQKKFTFVDEVLVAAGSEEEAIRLADQTWEDLDPHTIGDYEETGELFVQLADPDTEINGLLA